MIITPVILAAGESSRMGIPKALLDFDGVSALDLILRTCRQSGAAAPIVILGASADRIRSTLPSGITTKTNADFRNGQTSSLKAGLRILPPEADGFLLFPVDLPLVRPATVERIGAAAGPIVVPVHAGRRGHPARFERTLVTEFLALADHQPAHQILRSDPGRVTEIDVEDPAVIRKMNTPEEYQDGLRAFRASRRIAMSD
jgi:molybdenum cofactor cytidylyltransferase